MDVGTVELTELEKLEVTRVDAVSRPANGFPVLLMKGLAEPVAEPAVKGARDCPKCDKSYDADHTGAKCENCGTDLPDAPAAKSLPDWHRDAVALVKKAMVRGKVDESADIDGGQQAIALVGKLIGYEAQELAAGNLGEVADIGLLADAAGLLRQWVSGESAVQDGNVMPATMLMQSAAEDDDDTEVDQIAKEGTDVDTETQTGDLEEVVKAAEAKAAVLEKRVTEQDSVIKAFEDRLAKVEAAPVLGGPVMSAVRPKTAPDGEDHARKAAYYEDWADRVASPEDADRYRQLAAQERSKIQS